MDSKECKYHLLLPQGSNDNGNQSGRPTIDPTKLAPFEDGTQLCKLQLDEFTARATVTVGVQQEQAQRLYIKLWSLHIDSRTLMRKETLNGSKADSALATAKTQKNRVLRVNAKPGTFFRLEGGDIVMVMGRDSKITYVCAELCLSDNTDNCYELFVARQKVVQDMALGAEISVEYDTGSRYYHLKR